MRKLALLLLTAATLSLLSSPAAAGDQPAVAYGTGYRQFSLATGSPGELGLLKVLAETFGRQENATMTWVKAGSGKSLELLRAKKVDLIMVHAPKAEKLAVQEGWATRRTLIGSNEFVIVGPPKDPAKIAGAKDVLEAYRRIAAAKAKFLSRGDNSGTHKKEMDLWTKAGVQPWGELVHHHQGFHDRHLEAGQPGRGLFHGGQQHLGGGEEGDARSEGPVQGRQNAGQHLPRLVPAGRGHPGRGHRRPVHRFCGLPPGPANHPGLRQGPLRRRGFIMTRPTPGNMPIDLASDRLAA